MATLEAQGKFIAAKTAVHQHDLPQKFISSSEAIDRNFDWDKSRSDREKDHNIHQNFATETRCTTDHVI